MAQTVGGARLAYFVVKLDTEIEREVCEYVSPKTLNGGRQPADRAARRAKRTKSGIVRRMIKQPGGFLVYFPRGHVIRFRDEDHLAQFGLDKEPPIINMKGLYDANSKIGRMMNSQDEEVRRKGYSALEKHVVQLATAKSGPVLMPEQVGDREAVQQMAMA